MTERNKDFTEKVLSQLENLDSASVEEIAEEYPALGETSKRRILNQCMKKTGAADTGDTPEYDEITVSGTERYKRPKWYSIAAYAAVFVLAFAGIGKVYSMRKTLLRAEFKTSENSIVAGSDILSGETTTAVYSAAAEKKKAIEENEGTELSEEESTNGKNDVESVTEDMIEADKRTEYASEYQNTADNQDMLSEYEENIAVADKSESSPPENEKNLTSEAITDSLDDISDGAEEHNNSSVSNNYDIFERLNSLSYYVGTCDGLPEYRLIAGDGTLYELNFSSKWVWIANRTDPTLEKEEAVLPDDIISWLNQNKDSVNLETINYSEPINQKAEVLSWKDCISHKSDGNEFYYIFNGYSCGGTRYPLGVAEGETFAYEIKENTATFVFVSGGYTKTATLIPDEEGFALEWDDGSTEVFRIAYEGEFQTFVYGADE